VKVGHYTLIAGAGLFIAGLAVLIIYALPIAQQIQVETSVLHDYQIRPREVALIPLLVNTTKPLSIVISSDPQDVKLNAVMVDPDRNDGVESKINSTFTGNLAVGAEPSIPGYYNLTITNIDDSPTSINVIYGHLPGAQKDGFNTDVYSGVVTGVGIVIAGIMAMIIGVVMLVVRR
jgi:hypothetical protein